MTNKQINVHIINHTHWDREWFLTSVYTSRWIPRLIDKLTALSAKNPDFRYLFDGQTLVVEDLLAIAPDYAGPLKKLIAGDHLQIGPYYCQPDWQLTGGEFLIRNLIYGRVDMQKHGTQMKAGWLVDTFGHISQAPQIHQMFGLDSVFVWRGVPQLEPYFEWKGADGRRLFAVDLFGGYRNLYGVTHVPEVAGERLQMEVAKLRPFYPSADIPLFDGYDLEDNPEDPLTFFAQNGQPDPHIALLESTPAKFAQAIAQKELPLPVISGELNSGKYGATFPGVYSARTYLKVMARDCQQLLFQVVEPLAVLARLRGQAYPVDLAERWGRGLLQNAVHDCICGVSIDQVHEKMEYSYRQIFTEMVGQAEESLATLLADFAPDDYAISTNPLAEPGWYIVNDELVWSAAEGVGVWAIEKRMAIEAVNTPLETFSWNNDHYSVTITADGRVQIGNRQAGRLEVWAEQGDTYSSELGEKLGELRPFTPLTLLETSDNHAVLGFRCGWQNDRAEVTADVQLQVDDTPLLRWQIDLDSRGTDLRIEFVVDTGQPGTVFAGMPFDVVQRPIADNDLLPRQLPPELEKVLLGQRELNRVTDFPFHDFVALANESGCTAVLAKGLHAYSAAENGTVSLTLRRTVEWLTKSGLRDRDGDAGPFFYVPDGRCERLVRHEIAVAVGSFAPDSLTMQRLNAAYQNPPLIVEGQGHGSQTQWPVLRESLPLSSLAFQADGALARLYNPTSAAQELSQSFSRSDVWGDELGTISTVEPKQIATVKLPLSPSKIDSREVPVTWHNLPPWRVGDNEGMPDKAVLEQLQEKTAGLAKEIAALQDGLEQRDGRERLRQQHRIYVLDRERLEYKLSLLLNRRKLATGGKLLYDYLYKPDDEIASLGMALNRLRIKRRIFDYVVTVL